MTVSSLATSAGPYLGNGVATSFAFTFKAFSKEDVQVTVTDTSSGVSEVLVLDSDYSVTLNADQNATPGGAVTYLPLGAPMTAIDSLVIFSNAEPTQGMDIANAGNFLPNVLEDALDRIVMLIQQVLDKADRSLKAPAGDDTDMTLPPPATRALKGLVFDVDGKPELSVALYDLNAALLEAAALVQESQDNADLARDWAVKTDGAVADGEFSAKFQALAAAASALAAALSETTASDHKVAAAASAASAGTDALAADNARQDAEAARDDALNNAGIYVDTATAIADVSLADGKFFSTPSGVTGGFLQLWRKSGGVALPYKISVSTENFTDLNGDQHYSLAFGVDDTGLRAAGGIRKADSTLEMKYVEFFDAIITAIHAGTLTTTGAATLASAVTGTLDMAVADAWNLTGARMAMLDGTGLRGVMRWEPDDWVRFHSARATYADVTKELTSPLATISDVTALRLNGVGVDALVAGTVTPAAGSAITYGTVHVKGYGQSLNTGVQALPTTTWAKTQNYNSVMFNGGARPQDTGLRTALVPLVEADLGGLLGETGATAAAYAIQWMLATYDGITTVGSDHRLLMSMDGEGGKTLTELMDPALYGRLTASVTAGRSLVNAAGQVYRMGPSMISHGENEAAISTPRLDYYNHFEVFRLMLQATSRTALGDTSHIEKVLMMQTASHLAYGVLPNIPFAQADMDEFNPNCRVACPFYPFAYNTADNIHVPPITQEHAGLYWGVACYYWFYKRRDWHPMRPIKVLKQGNVAYFEFNPVGGTLDFDTTRVTANTGNGFALYDALHASVGITSVDQVQPTVVKVTGAAPWTVAEYAGHGTAGKSGKTQGARGNIRGRQHLSLPNFNLAGNVYEMCDWCIAFGKTLG